VTTAEGFPRDSGPVFREAGKRRPSLSRSPCMNARIRLERMEATLAEEIRRAQSAGDPDTGETYYAIGSRRWSGWSSQKA